MVHAKSLRLNVGLKTFKNQYSYGNQCRKRDEQTRDFYLCFSLQKHSKSHKEEGKPTGRLKETSQQYAYRAEELEKTQRRLIYS
jgi:hypothetical protein